MRSALILGLVAAITIGCGGGSPSPHDLIQGDWYSARSDLPCVDTYSFAGSEFSRGFVCTLTSGKIGLEAQEGTFVIVQDQFQFTIAMATCAGSANHGAVDFVVSEGGPLVLKYSNASEVFQRTNPSTGTGQAFYGCYDDAGNFTASEFMPIF